MRTHPRASIVRQALATAGLSVCNVVLQLDDGEAACALTVALSATNGLTDDSAWLTVAAEEQVQAILTAATAATTELTAAERHYVVVTTLCRELADLAKHAMQRERAEGKV